MGPLNLAAVAASASASAASPAPSPSPSLHAVAPAASGVPVWVVIVVGLAALLAGYAIGRKYGMSRRSSSLALPAGNARPGLGQVEQDWERVASIREQRRQPPIPYPQPVPEDSASVTERAKLVASCADLADRLRERQPGLYAVLTRDLEAVGVTVKLADGETFDPQRHNSVDIELTSDPAANLRVATTVKIGYLDHGSVVRNPDVIVYRSAGDGYGR